MLADVYNMQRYYRYADPQETRAKGLDAATRALEIDSSTPEAYIAMANLQVGGKDGLAGSKRLLEKAIELSPYNSTARLRYAWVIVFDDMSAASEQMRLAQEYDPLSPISNGAYCNILIFQGRYRDATPFCEKAADINPTSGNSEVMLADVYFYDGRVDDAIRVIKQRMANTTDQFNLTAHGSLAFYLLRSGRRAEAEPIVAKLTAAAEKEPELNADMAVIYSELGNREKGLHYFKKAYELRQIPELMVKFYPAWDKVRTDPQVQLIMSEPGSSPLRPASNSNLK
jgi:tetratricopeptide (TPR) repeat protein